MAGQRGRIAEVRVHGVSGTPIESMLDDPWPCQVAGDDDGRIFRRTHDTPPDRVVEGYHWGRYTAGSPARALWLLLLPFALVNVARFALLLPVGRRRRDRIADAVLRTLGLLMTVTIVVTTCYLAWAVLARQCTTGSCEGDFWLLDWFGDRSPGVRLLTASLLPVVVLAVLWQFDRLAFPLDPPGLPRPERPDQNGDVGDAGFWRGPQQASAQRAAHVWAGCSVAGLLALAMLGDLDTWTGLDPLFTLGCAVVTLALVAGLVAGVYVVVANPPPERDPTRVAPSDGHDTTALLTWMRVARYATVTASFGAVALAAAGLDQVLPRGVRPADTLLAGIANGVSALLGLLLLALLGVTVWLANDAGGRELRAVPKPFRPFFGGLAGWMGAALGTIIGLGMSAAAVFWTARTLGTPVLEGASRRPHQIEVASVYWIMAAVCGALALLLAVSLLPLAAWLLRRKGWWALFAALAVALAVAAWRVLPDLTGDRLFAEAEWLIGGVVLVTGASLLVFLLNRDGFEDRLCADYTEKRGLERARARVAARWRIALVRYRYHHVLGLLALLGGLAVIVAALACGWLVTPASPPRWLMGNATGPLGQLGVVVVSFGATGLVVLGLGTWRRPGLRTGVGIIWDLLSFWPRLGHPLCPPPYGGRAVLAVAGRASQLANEPLLDGEPASTIVLSGHSQGSVITAAACAVLIERQSADQDDDLRPDRARVARTKLSMITYGSQLQFLYARFFPSYFGFRTLRGVYQGLDGRWRSVYRWTDPLGGPVLAWAAPTSKSSFGPDISRWQRMGCGDDCPGHEPVERCGCPDRCPRDDDPAARCPYPKYWAVGADLRLRDPATIEDSAYQPRRAARGHSGYPSDPAYECVFGDLTAVTVESGIPSPVR